MYLRGETCQNIFTNYLNLINSSRLRPPFGVVQIGKAFRNEVTTKQFVLRTREFEQMEFEFFVHPDEGNKYLEHWKERFIEILSENLAIPVERFRYRPLPDEEKPHYAHAAYDLQ